MKRPSLILVFCAVLFAAVTVTAGPIQWDSASGGNDNYYSVILLDPVLTWENARSLANLAGGHLATITSEAENDFVFSLLTGDSDPARYWLGGYQTSKDSEPLGNWAWITGESWSYTNWAPGEPNNGMEGIQDYLHYWPSGGLWDDMENGRYMAGYIMESETAPVPEPATMLLFGTGIAGLVGWRSKRKR